MVMLMDQVIHSEYLQIENLKKHVLDRESHVQALEQHAAGCDSRIQALEQDVVSRDSRIQVLEQDVVSRDSRIQALEQHVSELKQSITFRLTTKFDEKLLGHIFPMGSEKRIIYDFCLKGGRILVNEGRKSAWWNFNQYLKTKRT
jgi:predicted RNase H-like nuclease (RuvC/YqgF family)